MKWGGANTHFSPAPLRIISFTMHRLVFLFALAALCHAQYRENSQTAAILSDARYLSGDGKFGSAYKQEDGVEFHEESDADGNRRGSYSYVDPNGQRRTISYTAGKNGFQATGDHLPVPPPAPAPVAPQPQYQPLPQYNPPAQPQYNPQPQYNNPGQYDDGSYREEYNNPNYQPRHQPTPAPANPGQYSYSFGNPQAPAAPQYNPAPQIPYHHTTTPSPHRFFPPGKLDLNRTPDGFSYTFNKS